MAAEQFLTCDGCGKEVTPEEFVGLVMLDREGDPKSRRLVVKYVGAQIGQIIDCDVWLCLGCLNKGERIGRLAIGNG